MNTRAVGRDPWPGEGQDSFASGAGYRQVQLHSHYVQNVLALVHALFDESPKESRRRES